MFGDIDFEGIVSEHYASLYRFALSLSRSEVEAADLTQQTFFIFAQHSRQIRDVSKVKSWLFTTLRREFLRGIRAQNNHPHVEFKPEIHDSPALSTDALRRLDGKAVMDAMAKVDTTYRVALELFYLSELSYKEIAQVLEIPIGTVMSRLSRGKEQLKTTLSESVFEQERKIIPLPRDEKASH